MKRIAILDEDGTTEINGIRHKLVPVDITQAVTDAWNSSGADDCARGWSRWDRGEKPDWEQWARDHSKLDWDAMLAAAKPDLSALPVVPQMRATRRGHTTLYQIGFNNALFAIGVKQYPEAFC